MPNHHLREKFDRMKQRCGNPKHHGYAKYGGRGVYICEEWIRSFKTFESWAIRWGWTAAANLDIHRVDNNGPYTPANCCLLTPKEHKSIHGRVVYIPQYQQSQGVTDWAKDPRISVNKAGTLFARLARGWPAVSAILLPLGSTNPVRAHKRASRQAARKLSLARRQAAKKPATIERQVDRAIIAVGGDLTDEALRRRLRGVSRQRRHQLASRNN